MIGCTLGLRRKDRRVPQMTLSEVEASEDASHELTPSNPKKRKAAEQPSDMKKRKPRPYLDSLLTTARRWEADLRAVETGTEPATSHLDRLKLRPMIQKWLDEESEKITRSIEDAKEERKNGKEIVEE
ncbi:hypothetical protein QR680_003809 [Steinernema hermaphroditum]|uniref:Uncharacterized protein n=1 Tax=Steinernema hermaphroditum TaxID=289476 RepID=A0AA39HNW5_9BILA|nr:hypothetical protein QR680_003809 [Steinernema hermaphroditum]